MEMVDEEAWKIVDEAERDMVTSPFDVSKDERSLPDTLFPFAFTTIIHLLNDPPSLISPSSHYHYFRGLMS